MSKPRVKLFRSIPCLTPAAINNRFVNATGKVADIFYRRLLKEDPWGGMMRRSRIADIMQERKCSETKAKRIYAAEHKKWLKEYNSPLAVANRKIAELEQRLETIKEFINDPNYLDRFD